MTCGKSFLFLICLNGGTFVGQITVYQNVAICNVCLASKAKASPTGPLLSASVLLQRTLSVSMLANGGHRNILKQLTEPNNAVRLAALCLHWTVL